LQNWRFPQGGRVPTLRMSQSILGKPPKTSPLDELLARNAKGHKVAPYGLLQRKGLRTLITLPLALSASHRIRPPETSRCRFHNHPHYSPSTFRSYSPQDFPHELEIELPLEPLTALTTGGNSVRTPRCHIRCRCTNRLNKSCIFASTAYSAFRSHVTSG